MSNSRAAIFATRIAGAVTGIALAVAIPLLGTSAVSGADPTPTPPPAPTATTNGHGWIG